jgi:cell division cycle 20, cofactor of APC complex
MAWCPWKPDLLATGSSSPDGKIRIWSTSSISNHNPEPLHTISLSTSVHSLHWSPHCKELLSTQGSSFVYMSPPRSSRRNNTSQTGLPFTIQTALTNSIAVHEYPSCKRLLTLTQAHASAVTHSCISPNGEHVFTVSPREEAIKMWQVWAEPPSVLKESAFAKFTIR